MLRPFFLSRGIPGEFAIKLGRLLSGINTRFNGLFLKGGFEPASIACLFVMVHNIRDCLPIS
ncbi:hypothetical protein LX87_02144 [Larkinella arboricola]|uniref:Uncharacterized protein n=1 Tax=Larkinella arboricola TaxID=643671 RepID=A0A327X2J5_LARAB|nr:hypothetical protein LX87_02144 [Larkinella arboricola]